MRTILILICFVPLIGLSQYQQDSKLANEYFLQGENDKAREMFEALAKNKQAIPIIHSNYFSLLINDNDWKTAEKYLERAIKFYPTNLQFDADQLFYYHITEQTSVKNKYETELIKKYGKSQYQLSIIAQNLVNKEMHEDAVYFLEQARRANGNPNSFSLELAAIYRMLDHKEEMTEEYLNYAMSNPRNLNYIKNIFQTLLDKDEDLNFLEEVLIKKVQQNPDQMTYAELLVWIELQRKDFYGAFIQARAIDKRLQKEGDECMKIGRIAMDNQAWDDAIEIYQYIINEFGDGYHYPNARKLMIKSKEELVKSTFPVNLENIRQLTSDYQNFYDEVGPDLNSLDALRNSALLHAFYLDEKEEAIRILEEIISIPRLNNSLVSSCKLSLGDIYLLIDNPWEASLLYSQVEKSNKYAEDGYEAKLRNAKLHYYTGNFILAKAHLDVLKNATTKTISNDAIALSLLIATNTAYDTSDIIMQHYANIELLLYQNKNDEAVTELMDFINANPYHSLVDESRWLLSQIFLRQGKFDDALKQLDEIIIKFSYDILADDAFFKKAEIVENHVHDTNQAQDLYQQFLLKFPGSMYAAEARKRFRELRGDYIN